MDAKGDTEDVEIGREENEDRREETKHRKYTIKKHEKKPEEKYNIQ